MATATPEPETNAAPEAPPAPPAQKHYSFRRFLESAVLFVSVILVIRAIALEPFGVPTGSMAQTLCGNHKACVCPRCGYPVVIGSANGAGRQQRDPYRHAFCANCGEVDLPLDASRECTGDRLLVDKNVFELRKPRRWEVAVFRCPFDGNKPYVKRVIGCPGERVLLRDGDVFINDVLARKSLDQCRALRTLIFDNNFRPPDHGWRTRWQAGPPDLAQPDPARNALVRDADPYLDGPHLRIDPRGESCALFYRNWLIDEKHEAPIHDDFGYNGNNLPQRLNTVHDFAVECDVEATGDSVLTIGLRDGRDDVTLHVPAGKFSERLKLVNRDGEVLATSEFRLDIGRTYRVEYFLFDRRVILAIDGREVFPAVDLPVVSHRQPMSRPCWLGARTNLVYVRNFKLYRDVHYSATGGECRNGVFEPWPLGPDEYFLLGDNSANSQDSRFWTNAGIPESCFMGRPLLLHQPSHWAHVGSWQVECIDWQRIRWIR